MLISFNKIIYFYSMKLLKLLSFHNVLRYLQCKMGLTQKLITIIVYKYIIIMFSENSKLT